jgi:GR25 family glycosyltransferase involved in LPS biosynthesis
MYIDNVLILEDDVHTQEWRLHELSSENKHILIEVYQNDIFDYKKEYILSEELLESIKLKSRINYH